MMDRKDIKDVKRIAESRNISVKDLVMGNISEGELSKILESMEERRYALRRRANE